MSSQTNNVVITLLFEDDFTRNITFEGVASADLADVKDKIREINANDNNDYANFYQTFVSDEGEDVIKIESCRIVATEEEVIYSG